jgi:hypothetical protein
METRITNIILEGSRFRIFAIILGNEETNVFAPEVTAQDIRDWVAERVEYYQELRLKEEALKEELINVEL